MTQPQPPTPDLAAIEARWKAVTPGAWTHRHDGLMEHLIVTDDDGHWVYVAELFFTSKSKDQQTLNADAIAHAPTDIAALFTAAREATARAERAEAALRVIEHESSDWFAKNRARAALATEATEADKEAQP